MIYSKEVEEMCPVAQGVCHGCAPIPEEANASGNGVRNILLGGLGVVALGVGLFLILLAKKKEEDK